MTKHLLTALLIAGFSVTAKAEPTVYYCHTTAFATLDERGLTNVRSYPFKLFVDLGTPKTIKVVGDIQEFEAIEGYGFSEVFAHSPSSGLGENAFFGSTGVHILFDFRNDIFAMSFLGDFTNHNHLVIQSLTGRCDKF